MEDYLKSKKAFITEIKRRYPIGTKFKDVSQAKGYNNYQWFDDEQTEYFKDKEYIVEHHKFSYLNYSKNIEGAECYYEDILNSNWANALFVGGYWALIVSLPSSLKLFKLL